MEKKYKINDEFIDILIKHGFVDATLKQHLNKPQKRRFKKPNINGQRTITFDYDSIVISPGEDSRNEISEGELKLVLLFFKLKNHNLRILYQMVNLISKRA